MTAAMGTTRCVKLLLLLLLLLLVVDAIIKELRTRCYRIRHCISGSALLVLLLLSCYTP